MKKLFFLTVLLSFAFPVRDYACTNFIITKGASTDGSVMVSYSADSHLLYGSLYKYNAPRKNNPRTMIPMYEWETKKYLGEIRQVEKTYSTVGNMNEYQVCIAETTFGGREELVDPHGQIDYGNLIYIALQRAKTAREAIDIIVELANEYGYASGGESFSIADPNEVWIMELIGKGYREAPQGGNMFKGIAWVARRVPDGYISSHANQARITQFPLNDSENCLYAPDVISFARSKGYYDGPDHEFSFSDAYAPLNFSAMRACEARVWSFFRMFAQDDMEQYLDYAMGHNKENRMPLWVKPKRKISPKEVFDAMRDHYEGTPLDMTKDIGAGGEECPYRWRPMSFEVDGVEYVNERAIATQQTGFWFVSQSRDWLPNHIGGILWFGTDDAATSALTPIYCSTTEAPESLREGNGSMLEYSETASFWIFNRVAQFAYLRYNVIGKNVRAMVDEWEYEKLREVERVDAKARQMGASSAKKYLTKYTVNTAQDLFHKWVDFDKYLMVKYIDGNVKKEDANGFINNGNDKGIPVYPEWPGYTEKWKRAVVKDAGEILKVVE